MSETDQLAERRKAYILLRIQLGDGGRLKQSELPGKFGLGILRQLDLGQFVTRKKGEVYALDRPALDGLLEVLVEGGYLTRSKEKRTVYLTITETGQALLFASKQYETIAFTIKGEQLNRLFTDIEARLSFDDPTPVVSPAPPVDSERFETAIPLENLASEVLAELDGLLQEQFADSEVVPIHLIRSRLAERLGESAASHDTLDPVLQQLARQRKVRLMPISDNRDASEAELAASIPGVNETLFYVKAVHEPARV